MKKLSTGIDRFTVDLSLISAVIRRDYQNRICPDAIIIKDKSGNTLFFVEYANSALRDIDYNKLITQWAAQKGD